VNSTRSTTNVSNLGVIYELPPGIVCGSDEAKLFMAGSYNFKVKEIEIFKVIIKM
jgi:hypothetical protein